MANSIPLDDAGDSATIHRRDVLVIDDSRTSLQVIGRRLSRMGYRTMLCESGGAGIDQLHARRFDIVLLDMVMPGLSGIRTLREIRGMSRNGDVPVLMMTARSDSSAAIEALAEGADDHVAKPFEFEVLSARIDRLLDRARAFQQLRLTNAALDARNAERAAENGELRDRLIASQADRDRLAAAVTALEGQLARVSSGTSGRA